MKHEALLSCRGLEAGYGASQVLFGLDFDIHAGEVLTLLGRNGMGKSTTIKTLIGGLRAKKGEIRFGGKPIHGARADAIARLGVAIVPEGRQCFPNLTVREHLLAFADNRNGLRDAWTLDRLYGLFPRLKERAGNMGNQLSGGEQQMLAIARALSTNPRLLILDEATEGLAPVIRDEIWRCLDQLKAVGQTTLVVDKYVEKLVLLADRHIILERGRIAWTGSSVELDSDRGLWTRYLGV
ncbi:ATP-binding cassette domain-containing protein [Azoarcus communis]|uniref:ABC transporter ATP-binding protein n=1 Tax=Parazoarcus communis SWub3 = DSM 12120 TaxID=1121029 RepID=A0A323UU84_9RHOO|nr:ABC transporter ATP-binding protein [Parazoarcus communis]NMG49098.1 ATP-binding cassette domain-containing protein [Parazoarcus communis]NMG71067.1 ATP-binding cassette domain-containing protein [Parazoarcus communis SWub3 = DSM 12120]PZA15230.1 ABC transporter ATP-binding protein [Azoarcus communis] [Parazoarcus communis SWub3 = DSM 12120]